MLTPTAEAVTPSPKFSPKNVIPFFSTTISGNQNDEIVGITSTKKNWVVAGNVVGDFLGTTSLGGVDSWVSAFDSSGANVWALRVGTSEDDLTTAIAVDSKEQIWVAGLAQSEKNPIVLESMNFPEPVIGLAIEPKTQADVDKLGIALGKLAEEDPTFRVNTDQETGQTVISGMGELHLDILMDRLKREFKVEVNQGAPQVAYKEAITGTIQHRETYKKQTGGRGKFADIQVIISPIDADYEKGGLQFVNEISGGSIPREFIPSVEKGFAAAMVNGVLAGYPLPSMKVRLIDGSFHAVDSDALSFEIAARSAFREALPKAKPVLMEPIMKVEILTPEENMGDVIGDMNRRRGQLQGMDTRAGSQVIKALVPLSEMFGYVTQLRTITSGRATSTMEFDHYAEAPRNVQDEVIAKVKGKSKE